MRTSSHLTWSSGGLTRFARGSHEVLMRSHEDSMRASGHFVRVLNMAVLHLIGRQWEKLNAMLPFSLYDSSLLHSDSIIVIIYVLLAIFSDLFFVNAYIRVIAVETTSYFLLVSNRCKGNILDCVCLLLNQPTRLISEWRKIYFNWPSGSFVEFIVQKSSNCLPLPSRCIQFKWVKFDSRHANHLDVARFLYSKIVVILSFLLERITTLVWIIHRVLYELTSVLRIKGEFLRCQSNVVWKGYLNIFDVIYELKQPYMNMWCAFTHIKRTRPAKYKKPVHSNLATHFEGVVFLFFWRARALNACGSGMELSCTKIYVNELMNCL